jgi:endonuclease/exonuclease/phosphatase family metal-dependent hydrolase
MHRQGHGLGWRDSSPELESGRLVRTRVPETASRLQSTPSRRELNERQSVVAMLVLHSIGSVRFFVHSVTPLYS